MTNEEIFNKIKQYESKWGKLGHTNIMNPEKNTIYHSGTNKDISQGGNKTMSRLDNELYKFRQKVAAGKEANKLAHKSYISPDELNKMNYDQLMKSHTLIHAANPTKGQQRENVKYYRREGQPGNYTYYYTKEEYDAAHSNGSAADANREAKSRSAYETNKKIENYKNKQNVTNTSSNTRENNLQADFTKKFSDIARQSPEAAAKEIINDDNTKIKTFYNKINDGFRKGVIIWKNGRFEKGEDASDSDYENIKDEIESYSDQLEKFVKDVDTAAGSGRKTKDSIAKMMTDEIESMYQKTEKGKENLKANQNSREAAIKKAYDDEKAREENKTSKEYKEATGEKEPSKSENNESWKERQDKILDDAMKDDANLKDLASKYNVSEEYIQELVYNVTGKTLKKEEKKSSDSSNNSTKTSKEYDAEKEYNSKKNSYGSAKHSALITNSTMGDEIMDEYAIFQEKVKRGKEMNRIAHSTFISPEELNSRYEKDLEKEGILVHAGNYKYYNKIDLPNGTTRYFYTKAEWDAYQDGQGQTAKKKQDEMIRKNKEASQHEGDRYTKKSLPESATMTDEERKEMYEGLAKKAKIHNQQIETFKKNAEAAKHEGDRFIKDIKVVIKDSTKNTSEQTKTPESEVPKQDNVEEQKKQEAANKEIEKRNTINYITETFNNSDLAENFAQAIAFTDVYGADESAKKILADNNTSMDNTVEDVMNQLREAYGEDAAQEFFNNAQAILQEKYNKYYNMYIAEKNATDLANQQMINQMMFGY